MQTWETCNDILTWVSSWSVLAVFSCTIIHQKFLNKRVFREPFPLFPCATIPRKFLNKRFSLSLFPISFRALSSHRNFLTRVSSWRLFPTYFWHYHPTGVSTKVSSWRLFPILPAVSSHKGFSRTLLPKSLCLSGQKMAIIEPSFSKP